MVGSLMRYKFSKDEVTNKIGFELCHIIKIGKIVKL